MKKDRPPLDGMIAAQAQYRSRRLACRASRDGTQPPLKRFRASLAENKMHAFIKRFLMHYGIYRRYPLGRFPALRNAWRAAQS
jgi:hypothetical protein